MKTKTALWILLAVLTFVMGMYAGSILQQEHFIKGAVLFAEGLEGTNIEVNIDLNETRLVDGFTESFIPILNQTLQEDKCCYPEECTQAKDNPEECNCVYAIMCGSLE